MKKTCCRCGLSKPLSEFTKNRARKDGYNQSCQPCHKAYQQAHYASNKAYYIKKAKVWTVAQRRELVAIVEKAKDVPCLDCGVKYPPYVLEFDHVRGVKVNEVSLMVAHGVAVETLLAEIQKCEVVCANCHKTRTHHRRQAAKHSPVAQLERAPVYETGSVGGSSPLGAA